MDEEASRKRRLRKYEAAANVAFRQEGSPPLDLLQPFGPLIGRCEMPPALVASVNNFCAAHVARERNSEFILSQGFVFAADASLGAWIEAQIRRYVEAVEGAPPRRVRIEAVWIVSQYAGAASPVHFHSGDISGVAYLATPELAADAGEEERTYISGRQAGYLNFLIGGKQRFSKSLMSIKPREGDFYVFPGWLLHGVEPFRGRGERRSLAFNAYVDAAEA
jgi:uncharacterized protein (TIGR02466 family)